jgi:NAD(P)-dependent dehydrogenase (short-subunit alcohol dehydrogenase family)
MDDQRRQVVVVTGASAGVGRAVARQFAQSGASLGLIARGEERLNAARQEVEAAGGEALALPLDVADAEAVERAAETVERELGPIDIWINSAMATVFAPVHRIEPAEFRRVTEVTYLGFVYGTLAALKHMRPRNRGTIVQVGSALAYRGIPLQSAYCGAKHAIQGFTESLRCELMHDGSRIHDGQSAGREHPPIRLVSQPHAPPGSTRAADLSAGGRRPGDPPRRVSLSPRVERGLDDRIGRGRK